MGDEKWEVSISIKFNSSLHYMDVDQMDQPIFWGSKDHWPKQRPASWRKENKKGRILAKDQDHTYMDIVIYE